MQIYSLLPPLSTLVAVPAHPKLQLLYAKLILMGKTAIFIADTFYFHVFMFVLMVIFVIVRVGRKNCSLYGKLNPYLLTYSFRLLSMEFAFSAILYFAFIQLDHPIMKWSLAFLLIDIIFLGLSFFWKIRTELEPTHAHYALFYFN